MLFTVRVSDSYLFSITVLVWIVLTRSITGKSLLLGFLIPEEELRNGNQHHSREGKSDESIAQVKGMGNISDQRRTY